MNVELYCKGFHNPALMCMYSRHPVLIWKKLAPHFGLQINTVSLCLEHIIFTTKLKNRPYKVTRKSCSCALKATMASLHLLFGKVQLSLSLCEENFQWYILHRWQLFGRIISREESEGEKSLRPAHI